MGKRRFLLIVCLVASLVLSVCPFSLASADAEPDPGWALSTLEGLQSYLEDATGQQTDLSELDLMVQTSTLYDECYDRSPGSDGDAHMALGYLTSWRGPVPEAGVDILRPSIEPVCYVQGVAFLPEGAAKEDDSNAKSGKSLVANYSLTRVDLDKRYDNIYQHDILGYNYPLKVQSRSSSAWFANVFEAKGPYGEFLKAVSFYTLTSRTKYEVFVVPNFTGPASLGSGKKVAHGTLNSPGYHTIDLEQPVSLANASRFAVVVKQTASNRPAVAADSAKGYSVKRSVSQPGESFVRVNSGWKDLYSIEPNTNVCLKAFTVDAPAPPSEMVYPDVMKAELDYVLSRMRAENPTVMRNGFTDSQLAIIDDVRASIELPLTKHEYYFQLQKVFAMLNESQTSLWAWVGEKLYLNLPFVWLMDDGMIVSQDAAPLVKGDRVISVGGVSPEEITQTLRRIVSAENEYWVRHTARSVLQRGSYLDYLGLVNPDKTVDVAVLRNDEMVIYRIPLGRTYCDINERPVIAWHIEEDNNLGYLRFDTFPHYDYLASLSQEIEAFFSAVKHKGVSNVVVDWRYAGAGGGYAHVLHDFLGYFGRGPVYIDGYRRYSIDEKPESVTFKGNTYVLTSNRVFGATTMGAMMLHDSGIALTVGEPTGAKPNFSGSNRPDDKLPVTGWSVRISNLSPGRPRNVDPSETTLYPDIPVFTSRDDLLTGRDPQMETVRAICAGLKTVDY